MSNELITTVVEAFWLRLHAILTAFADRLAAVDPTLVRSLGRSTNDVFVLRGYLAFRRRVDGDEIAITIDVRSSDAQALVVESDVCTDDGAVIAGGPSGAFVLSQSQSDVRVAMGDWLNEFEQFLKENEPAVRKAVAELA